MMKRVRAVAALVAVSACLMQACLLSAEERNKANESSTDQSFVEKASAIDLAEINLGNLAARLGTNEQVKQFGQQMVADHTKSSKMLLAVSDKKSLKSATAMDKKHQELFDKLKTLSGAEFDRDYMKHMVMGHQKAVELYRQEAKQGKDEDLKAFAQKTLPTVEMHHKMAQEINDKIGKSQSK